MSMYNTLYGRGSFLVSSADGSSQRNTVVGASAASNNAGWSIMTDHTVVGYGAGGVGASPAALQLAITCIGSGANVLNGSSYSTAIGYASQASMSNQIVLGTSTETVYCPGVPTQGTTPGISLVAAGGINAPFCNTTSDYRIKQDVQKIPPYPNIDNLNPVTYQNTVMKKKDMGFIAHELQEHFPFLVLGEKDGPTNQSINYIGLIALLTKEIQELKARVLMLEEKDAADHQTR